MGIVNIFKCEFDLSEIVGSKLKLWIQRIFIYKDIFLKTDRFLKKFFFSQAGLNFYLAFMKIMNIQNVWF